MNLELSPLRLSVMEQMADSGTPAVAKLLLAEMRQSKAERTLGKKSLRVVQIVWPSASDTTLS